MLKIEDVLKQLTLSKATFYRRMKSGEAPKPVRVSKRRVAWRQADIDQYLNNCASLN